MAAPSAAPVVTVIVPCYNQARFLRETLRSILSQSYAPIESILVDDGSTDDTAAAAAAMSWSRYVYQPNAGTASARNTGLHHSRGELIVFLDADDRLLADAIATGVDALRSHPDWSFVSGHVQLIGEDGSPRGVPPQDHGDQPTYVDLLRSNYIWSPGAVMYRRGVLGAAPFRPEAEGSADFDLNIRLARRHGFGCHHRIVLEYRQHATSMTGNPRYMLRSAVRVRLAARRHVRGSAEASRALEEGIALVRGDFGERVVERVKSAWRSPRTWSEAVAGVACLLRYHPRGVTRLFTSGLARLRRTRR